MFFQVLETGKSVFMSSAVFLSTISFVSLLVIFAFSFVSIDILDAIRDDKNVWNNCNTSCTFEALFDITDHNCSQSDTKKSQTIIKQLQKIANVNYDLFFDINVSCIVLVTLILLSSIVVVMTSNSKMKQTFTSNKFFDAEPLL